ncbi:MAG TPA: SDR family oxidoreductase [Methanosarcinales archaeon]|nr:SDR family oxidoreductase [Methanosarcinales archaeon]
MLKDDLLISKGNLIKEQLKGSVVIVTGGGGGIGFEACRSLLWLGAKVVIAEVDKKKGLQSERVLKQEFETDNVCYIYTDVSSESSVKSLYRNVMNRFGRVDAIINNATVAITGAVNKVGIEAWDKSYKVNLRGPVLLATYFLKDMLNRKSGVMVFVSSSGAAPYLGAYEVFKTSQVELCNTLSGELEKSGVTVFSIGPGIVKTETADAAIYQIASLYGKTVDEFYKMSEKMLLTMEQAGAGFAASIALAEKYNGMEISSIQALIDIGINIEEINIQEEIYLTIDQIARISKMIVLIKATLKEQLEGWQGRPVFERQWVLRDFKKYTGFAPEYFLENIKYVEVKLQQNKLTNKDIKNLQLDKLHSYYLHQLVLLRGYEKNQNKLQEYTEAITIWINEIEEFNKYLEASWK